MPLTFLNGNSPDYAGQSVADGNAILTSIQSTLQTAGWTTESTNLLNGNTEGQFVLMKCESIVGNISVYYKFSIADNSANIAGGHKLIVQGSDDLAFSAGNTSKLYTLDYIDFNTDSRLWVTADEETFALCLISFASLAGGIHGGFLNRIEPTTDNGAYCIGYILSNIELKYTGYENASPDKAFYQIGRDAHSGRKWYEVLDAYHWQSLSAKYSQPNVLPVQGFFDRYTVGLIPARAFIETSLTLARRNTGFMAHNGNLNGLNGKAVLGEWFVTEGRNGPTDYATTGLLQTPLYYRGSTKFNVVGMASFSAGIQVEDSVGRRYLSVGSVGWSGVRIA